MTRPARSGMYEAVIERLFFAGYKPGARSVDFERDEIIRAAGELELDAAKNLGDLVYSFKYRRPLPENIRATAPEGEEWRLVNVGRARYRFVLGNTFLVIPDKMLFEIKIPDATPGIIARYALSDEQALLAKLRYNRLIDIFTGVACYSLQNHLRTSVRVEDEARETMQIETDEMYIGIDRRGAHYVFPVQAKGGSDKIAVQQIEQDLLLCRQRFSELICTPIAAQFMSDDLIALYSFDEVDGKVRKMNERHYRLVPKDEISDEEIRSYRERREEGS